MLETVLEICDSTILIFKILVCGFWLAFKIVHLLIGKTKIL